MMFQHGKVSTLQEMGEEFLAFAQLSNEDTQAWELVDNRLHSLFGATLRVPIKKYEKEGNTPYFYISLEHVTVTNSTYSSMMSASTINPYVINNVFTDEYSLTGSANYIEDYPFSGKLNRRTYSPDVCYSLVGKYDMNLFKNTGEFMAIGCHTLFDEDLFMCEQGGITCQKENELQVNDLNLLKFRSIGNTCDDSFEGSLIPPVVFPGTGCPWFTLSNDNYSTFHIPTNGIEYWFNKTDYSATISFKVHNFGIEYDCYQSMSFGMLDVVDDEAHLFPLFVAGGTEALSQDVYVYVPVRGTCPVYTSGNVYDLNIQNIALSNSNLLHPTKFNGANMSNFRIMSYEGVWKDIYAHSQNEKIIPYFVCGGCTPYWANVLDTVNDEMGNNYHSATPFYNNVRYKIDTYTVNYPSRNQPSTQQLTQYEHSSPLQKVVVSLDPDLQYNTSGVMGIVPNVYNTWYRTLPAGVVTLGGHKYLSIPNGWEERLWNYPYYVGVLNETQYWENERIRKFQDDLHRTLMQKKMVDRLIIPIGDDD